MHRPYVVPLLDKFLVGSMETPTPHGLPLPATTTEFRKLRMQLEAEGLFKPDTGFYARLALWLAVILSAAFWCASQHYTVAAAFLAALFWQQSAFLGHDAGHHAITLRRKTDDLLGLLANSGVGIGMSWVSHGRHALGESWSACPG